MVQESYPLGTRVRFRNADNTEQEGTVNGDPLYAGMPPLYVPVYVRESDQCMFIAETNIIQAYVPKKGTP